MLIYEISTTATAGPGAASGVHARRSSRAQRATWAQSQRPALLQAAAKTTACAGKEDVKAVRRVRHY